ncbi:MAG TPA: type III-B CRISPR module RAMP protein Cmr6 [Candidatus Ozemobacteraceae bacterium]|nr:type III-B CRISPR module RAMP protein Cmr6 [Candidatus Ozemobacteraceae bacterium]
MLIPAAPNYLQSVLTQADIPPGHRFSLFLPIWEAAWVPTTKEKGQALSRILSMKGHVAELAKSLVKRQEILATTSGNDCMIFPCISQAPFTTGLGNEHPLGNGFAFLTPYGIPYLSGSGVKGVMRRAAEHLALFPDEYHSNRPFPEFCLLDVWRLFGFEGEGCSTFPKKNATDEDRAWQKAYEDQIPEIAKRPDLKEFISSLQIERDEREACLKAPETFLRRLGEDKKFRNSIHTRGSLTFWDVIPVTPKGEMCVEVMTPHYSDYYQSGKSPHDSGSPNPIPFLAIPAETKFQFVIQARNTPFPSQIGMNDVVGKLLAFACKWLGFGAKTAIGYGALKLDIQGQANIAISIERTRKEDREKRELAALTEERKELRAFQAQFEKAQSVAGYKAGCPFDDVRLGFIKKALTWQLSQDRADAADILEKTIKWGCSDKRKKEFRDTVTALRSPCKS